MTSHDLVDDLENMALEPDDKAILEEMSALMEEAGNGRDHLPYDAALNYHESSDIRSSYQEHVDNCTYCQRLVDTLHPDLNKLQTIRVRSEFMEHPERLAALEASDDPHDKLKAADVYFALDRAEFAYERLGEGLESLFSLNATERKRVSDVFSLPQQDASVALRDIVAQLQNFTKNPSFEPADLLCLFEVHARLGQHTRAVSSLCVYLLNRGASPREIASVRDDLSSVTADLHPEDGIETIELSITNFEV